MDQPGTAAHIRQRSAGDIIQTLAVAVIIAVVAGLAIVGLLSPASIISLMMQLRA
jgi:hypothetical protein